MHSPDSDPNYSEPRGGNSIADNDRYERPLVEKTGKLADVTGNGHGTGGTT